MRLQLEPTECETLLPCRCCDRCSVFEAGAALIIPAEPEAIAVELPDPRQLLRRVAGVEVPCAS